MEMDRRKFLEMIGAGSAAILLNPLPRSAEAQQQRFEFYASELTTGALDHQKAAAVDSLTKSIPPDKHLGYLRDHARNLSLESQMYIPQVSELKDVVRKSEAQLTELARTLAPGTYGLFIFADVDADNNRTQRMYVVKRGEGNKVSFVKAYLVSTAYNGFGNDNDSEKTPLGLHSVHSGKTGLLGEVVSALNKNRDSFNRVIVNGVEKWFVKGFGREESNTIAEVVTDQYLLHGKHTSPERGIRIHGTNRSGELLPNRTWRTYLGGRRRSNGCIRMSNTDVRDLSLSGYISLPTANSAKERTPGTNVMIHATPAALAAVNRSSPEDELLRPRRRLLPEDMSQNK